MSIVFTYTALCVNFVVLLMRPEESNVHHAVRVVDPRHQSVFYSPAVGLRRLCHGPIPSVPTINDAIKRSLANPDLVIYKLKNTTLQIFIHVGADFLLPFLWLMFSGCSDYFVGERHTIVQACKKRYFVGRQ